MTILYVDPYAGCRIITLIELSSEHFTENFNGPSVPVFAHLARRAEWLVGAVSDFFTIDVGTGCVFIEWVRAASVELFCNGS